MKRVDAARNYIKALLVVCKLSSQALDLVKTDPEGALRPYEQLVKFEQYISNKKIVQEKWTDLSDYLKKRQTRLWEELYAVLVEKFKGSLDGISWPTAIKPPYSPELKEKLRKFEQDFKHLVILQQSSADKHSAISLSPISIMTEGLSLRFRYHFETSKPTNRLDKPEWYIMHVKNSIAAHMPFLLTTVQPIVNSMEGYFSEKASVKDMFIQSLLDDVLRKLQKTIPQILNQPIILSHTIQQVLEFDKSLSDDFSYERAPTLSDFVFDHTAWFDSWFQGEKKFSQTKYDEIVLDRKAFELEVGDANNATIKKTMSASRIISLLESVTATYQLMSTMEYKLKFLVDIQFNLLGQYHQRLSGAIDSFEALSLIRSVPAPGALPDAVTGVITSSESNGTISALNRLYRWWTSTKSIQEALKDWEEEEFFLDLYHQMKQDPEKTESFLKSFVSYQDKMIRHSCVTQSESSDGLFTDALTAFEQISKRIEKIFVKIALKEWTNNAREYSKKSVWWEASAESVSELSNELYTPLQDFLMTFNYLNTILPQHDFVVIYRNTLKEIEDWYWKQIITQNQFSAGGVLQLEVDLKLGLWKIGQRWIHKPENLTKRLREAITLLSLPLSSEEQVSCQELMKALVDTNQLETVQKTLERINVEFPHAGMDEWQYEMRREIQEIIPNVYLGPFSACKNTESLKHKGITHIVCFFDEAEANLFRTEVVAQHFAFERFIVSDTILQNLIQHFPTVSHYVNSIIPQGKVVLCCNGGMSRSPAFVVAYIMEKYNLDAIQAYHYVQAKRLCINPNDGFKCQLKEYEPIFRARRATTEIKDGNTRRRSRGEENEENCSHSSESDFKRSLRENAQGDQGANVMSPGYSSMVI
ncbi:TIP-1 family-domain-containing protein [Sporodiniella umbellata]|nr:TIP-1 family-domain-containing protein [Sporodiniella umbellata]